MKTKNSITLIISLIISVNLLSQPTDYIGYWPFNGNANDESSNNNNGSVSGANLDNGRFENFEASYSFNGNSYIEIPDNVVLEGMNELSISLWIHPNIDINTGNHVFVTKGYGWNIMYSNDGIRFLSVCSNDNGDFTYQTTLSANNWYHLVLKYNGNQIEGFLNGTSIGTESASGSIRTDGTQGVIIGARYSKDGDFFNGIIDDIMIFNRALEDCEIKSLFNNSNLCTTTSGLWQQNAENIYYDGKVSIGGTIVPTGFDFSVNGKIVTKEVKVTIDGWSDFVFKPNFTLMPINQLENYINLNKHLPSIPTESEVKESGISLGEMNAKLLQKIEELTLYMIEINKEIQILKNENQLLKDKMNIEE